MIVISDRTLQAAGIDFATAKALLAPADNELVVYVRQEQPDPDRITSPSIESLNEDLDVDSDIDTARLNTVPVSPQAEALNASFHRGTAATPTDSRSDVDQDLAGQADVADRGYTLGAAVKLAERYDCTLTFEGGLYTLESAFGRQPYTSLAEAVACIKQFARWREAVRQTIDTQTRRQRHERL